MPGRQLLVLFRSGQHVDQELHIIWAHEILSEVQLLQVLAELLATQIREKESCPAVLRRHLRNARPFSLEAPHLHLAHDDGQVLGSRAIQDTDASHRRLQGDIEERSKSLACGPLGHGLPPGHLRLVRVRAQHGLEQLRIEPHLRQGVEDLGRALNFEAFEVFSNSF